jgi:hypothetical protein
MPSCYNYTHSVPGAFTGISGQSSGIGEMTHVGNWVLGAATAGMAVGGIFVAARAGHGIAYYGGLVFSAFAVLFILLLIKTSFDQN